jgi:nicotinamidase-related amidase
MEELYGLRVPSELRDAVHPQRTVMLVYDMQLAIVSQVPEGAAIVHNVARLLAAARAHGYRVYFTRHAWLPPETLGIAQLRRARIWGQITSSGTFEPPFLPGSAAWQIAAELAPLPAEPVVDKIAFSAFCGTYLDTALRDAHIDSFMIGGIALEVGIEPTVRHACDLNYIPIVVEDACGFRDPEARRRVLDGFAFSGEPFVTNTLTIERLITQTAE